MDIEVWIMRAFGYDEDEFSRKAILNPVGQQAIEFFCSIIKSPTGEEYSSAHLRLERQAERSEDIACKDFVKYLDSQWYTKHKKLCVAVWTDQVRHYGMSTTSPGESAHAGLKGWLKTGRSDILTFLKKMGPFYDHHAQRYQADLAQSRNQASVVFTAGADYRFYHKLVRILTTSSLLLVRKQKEKCQAELKRRLNQSNYVIPAYSGVYNQTMGLPCSHQLEKYLPNIGSDNLTVQKDLFETWRLIPQQTRKLDEASVRLQETQIRTHRMVRSQRVVALHARNSGTFGTQREATRSERMLPDNRATPPVEGIGSSEMPTVFLIDPVDVSLIQSARHNGIPPPRKRTSLMKPIPPPGIQPYNCNKGCSTRSCRCRKDVLFKCLILQNLA
ncbi:hypothetical protein K3495_g7852 [Podosphaera aphanis]|nr:hypothetical protein K3495_g7852 [Podosphaera aphanis]